jgi:hypothetical protein
VADVSIPRDAVDKAGRALNTYESGALDEWDALTPGEQKYFVQKAEFVLGAVVSLIEAAYAERKGDEIKHTASAFFSAGKRTKGSWFSHIGDQLRLDAQRLRCAAELRAQS